MAVKAIFVFCASALLVQSISAQCINAGVVDINNVGIAGNGIGLAAGGLGLGNGLGLAGLAAPGYAPALSAAGYGPAYGYGLAYPAAASSGGAFPITSASPFAPIGISVLSENVIEGALAVGGQLPFLGAVALEGVVPSAGAAGVSYGCGNGAIGIEGAAGYGLAGPAYAPAAYGLAPGALGLAAGLPGLCY